MPSFEFTPLLPCEGLQSAHPLVRSPCPADGLHFIEKVAESARCTAKWTAVR